MQNILSGGCAGSLSLVFVQSIDYTRTRLATDAKYGGQRQFNGIVDCYVKTFRADGVRGLYRGFVVSCVCIFIYRGLYFGLYDSLKPVLLGDNAQWIATFFLGWAVTITSGLAAYPIDTVKRRMMLTSGEKVSNYPEMPDMSVTNIRPLMKFFFDITHSLSKSGNLLISTSSSVI